MPNDDNIKVKKGIVPPPPKETQPEHPADNPPPPVKLSPPNPK